MFRHAANLALLLIFTHATSTLAADPTNLSISARRIDAVFKDFSRETPGCALGLYRRGKVIYAKGYGMADLGLGVPITPATVFDIGSTSKQFAAAALLLLVQDGKVSLSDDVHRYIPELPEYSQSITVDQLLRHTSGLRDYNGLLYTAGHFFEDFTNDDDALSIIAAQHALNFAPGSEWDYTNTGYFLVSVIVKRVSGKSLAEFSKERLFTPLGMTVTHFRTDHTAVLANRATAYSARPKGGYAIEMSNWDQTGDGGINTNVTELAKWDGNFYDGRVGGRALVDALEQPGRLNNGDLLSYDRGLFSDTYRGLRRIHHGGAWAGYRAMLMRFPDQALSIGITCNVNTADTEARADQVADVVLAGAFHEPKRAVPEVGASTAAGFDATPYLGTFFSGDAGAALSVAVVERKPVLEMYRMKFPLALITADRLTAPQADLTLEFDAARNLVKVTDEFHVVGTFHRIVRVAPAVSDLRELVGSYRSVELGVTWTVRVEAGKVFVKGRAVGESELSPVMADAFESDQFFYSFSRDAAGQINGFDLSAGRMHNIRFDR